MIKITLPLMSMKDWRWNYLFLWQLDFYFSYYILILLICIALRFLRLPRQLLHYLTICTFYPCFAPYHFSYTLLTSPLLSIILSFSLSLSIFFSLSLFLSLYVPLFLSPPSSHPPLILLYNERNWRTRRLHHYAFNHPVVSLYHWGQSWYWSEN